MTTEYGSSLDLRPIDPTELLGKTLTALSQNRGRAACVVFPEARPDCCGRDDVHLADAFLRLACGCAYTYCRRALVIIYGRVMLRNTLCPRHGNERYSILVANWLT